MKSTLFVVLFSVLLSGCITEEKETTAAASQLLKSERAEQIIEAEKQKLKNLKYRSLDLQPLKRDEMGFVHANG